MKKTNILAASLAALLAAPALAQTEEVVINGAVIDWYAYGRDIHTNEMGWIQMIPGSVDHESNVGLMSLGVNTSLAKPLYYNGFPLRDNQFYANSGGVYTGDAYYTFFQHEVGWEQTMETEVGQETYETIVYKWKWDSMQVNEEEGLKAVNATKQKWGVLGYSFTDFTYDPINDKIYGIAYINSNNSDGYKLVEVDLTKQNNLKVRVISREAQMLTSELRCIAINSKGQLYGLDSRGSFYKVDKEDGSLTLVGNTGIVSQERMMSATFDFRTDKLYWVGFVNDGKIPGAGTSGTNTTLSVADGGRDTGVFEIDTETGKATLIGETNFKQSVQVVDDEGDLVWTTQKYGKMQLTGIYVEGSFQKHNIDQRVSIVNVPAQLTAGKKGLMTVNVKNIGLNKVLAKNYKVNFYLDNELFCTIDRDGDSFGNEENVVDNLDAGEAQDLTIELTAPQKPGTYQVYAEVVNEADEQQVNNKTEVAEIIVISEHLLPVPELKGQQQGNGILLTWADPDGRIVDGAEGYAAFAYNGLSDWTLYDGDGGFTQSFGSYNMAVSYPNQNTPKAFIVFNPEQSGVYLTGSANMFRPYGGEQYFASLYTTVPDDTEAGGHFVDNDDWMISPRLSGKAQTISFMAKGYGGSVAAGYVSEATSTETMRVLYTTDDVLNREAMQVAREEFTIDPEKWTKYTAELPEGTTYFALNCVSKAEEGMILMLDDITFQGQAREVKGYKVYRNGKLIKELAADQLSFTDARSQADDLYTVTAVYDEGESMPSNEMSINIVMDVRSVKTDGQSEGIRVFNLSGQAQRGAVRPGVYVVVSDGQARKVVVK